MNETTSLDGIKVRLEELERRVARLEHVEAPAEPEPRNETTKPVTLLPAATAAQGSGFIAVLGRAMLGIAGAYLLRALNESHLIAQAVLAPLAIVYALAWLAVASRSRRPISRAIFACTSVAILAPMLWELTMRFQVLPAWADALALAAMALAATAMARTADRSAVLQIAHVSAAALALALAVATHSNLPFLAVLLMLLALSQVATNTDRVSASSVPLALAADLGVWILIYLYHGPHADYPELDAMRLVAPGFLLFLITASSLVYAAIARRERMGVFAIAQTMAAFLLACCGLLYFGPASRLEILGTVCLLLAAIVYAVMTAALRSEADTRSRSVFATWSALLLLAGSFLAIPASLRSEWLGLCAVAASGLGARRNLLFLAAHGNVYLLAATVASGLGTYAWQSLAAAPAGPPAFSVIFLLVCAAGCYGFAQWKEGGLARPTSYAPAAIAMLTIAALLAHGFIALASLAFAPGSHHLALIRSLTLCSVALALALGGSMARRRELIQIAYAAVVLEAVKLFIEDLRHGHLLFVAASVCLFAITLIVLPRIAKKAAA